MEFDIRALADLLNPDKDESEDEEMPQTPYAKMTPGDIGPKSESSQTCQADPSDTKPKLNEALVDGKKAENTDIHDNRKEPEYDIIYKQAVSSEDMFLGMGNKTPATASCESIVVKIKLPDTKLTEVQLDVQKNFLNCHTSKFKLGLHLPQPVDEKTAKAQWDGSIFTLSVTLRMVRDYDFINF